MGVGAHTEGRGFSLGGTMILMMVEGLSRHTGRVCGVDHLASGRSLKTRKVASGVALLLQAPCQQGRRSQDVVFLHAVSVGVEVCSGSGCL